MGRLFTGSPRHTILGITGGLATGKSLVTRIFARLGATVFSADEAARAVAAPGGPVLRRIVEAFGPEFLASDGSLDRGRLARRIFSDPVARRTLEQITHPSILRLLRAQIDAAREDLPAGSIIAVEVPLLFEANLQEWFDRILVVSASESTQVQRLAARNSIDTAEALRRLSAQAPLREKVARADHVIVNDGDAEDLERAVEALCCRLASSGQGAPR